MKLLFIFILVCVMTSCANYQFTREYFNDHMDRSIGAKYTMENFLALGYISIKTETLPNKNIAYYVRKKFSGHNRNTDCIVYYEVDKKTSIIVGYKVVDDNPNKNCKLLGAKSLF